MEVPSVFESTLLFTAITLLTLTAVVAGYFKLKVSWILSKKLPPGSLGFPFVGESISFVRAQKHNKTEEWIRKRIDMFGPAFKTSLMGRKTVVLTGQAGNRFVFSGADNCISLNQPSRAVKIFGKYSLFEISGKRHKLIRGAIASFLKPESIQRYLQQMDTLVQEQLSKELNGKDSVQIVPLMKKITFNVICSIFFGLPDGEDKDKLLEDFSITLKGLWAVPVNIPGTTLYKALRARGRVCKLLSKLISTRKTQMEEGIVDDSQDNMISSLLALRDENGEPLLEQEVLDLFLSLIMASHETTTTVLSHLVRHLARDPEVSNNVLQEQREVVKAKKTRGKLSWNEMQMMKYTWRVAQELMRLTPPVFGNFRLIKRDITFDGFHIPKGWQLFWVAYGTHMDSNIFEDAEKFDPSRFDANSRSFPPYTYIPFGAGPRICPGAEFARIETLLVIHHLITKYEWTQIFPDEPITRDPVALPAMGLPVKLHLRNDV